MKSLNDITTGRRFFLIFGLIILVSLISFLFNMFGINSIKKDINSIYSIRLKSIDFLIEADRDAYQSSVAISQALNGIVYGNQKKLYGKIDAIKENMEQVKMRFDKFRSLYVQAGGKPDNTHLSVFDKYYGQWSWTSRQIMDLLKKGMIPNAEYVYFGAYETQFDAMRDSMDKLTDISLNDAESEFTRSMGIATRILIQSIIVILVTVLFMVAAGYVLTRSVTVPMGIVVDSLNRFSRGDLTMNVKIKGSDEAARMLEALKNMIQTQKGIIAEIYQGSHMLADASMEIGTTAQNLAGSASKEAANVEEIASSLEEMAAGISQNLAKSKNTDAIAQQTAMNAEKGGVAVRESINAIVRISEKINIIEDIAYQTNLLALNAAIEAARAG